MPEPSAAASPESAVSPEPETEPDGAGLSGKYKPEAEKAFAEARTLWRRSLSSLASAEVCADPEKADVLLSKAISLEPKYADAYMRRGLARSEMGQREEAFEDMVAAIRLDPSADYYAYRGLVLLRAGQEKAAQRDLEYALKLKPANHRAQNFMGVLELKRDSKKAACDRFTKGCSGGDCSFLEVAKKEKICP